jgi:hypothetical protein
MVQPKAFRTLNEFVNIELASSTFKINWDGIACQQHAGNKRAVKGK